MCCGRDTPGLIKLDQILDNKLLTFMMYINCYYLPLYIYIYNIFTYTLFAWYLTACNHLHVFILFHSFCITFAFLLRSVVSVARELGRRL